jgi:hypothetical protein
MLRDLSERDSSAVARCYTGRPGHCLSGPGGGGGVGVDRDQVNWPIWLIVLTDITAFSAHRHSDEPPDPASHHVRHAATGVQAIT